MKNIKSILLLLVAVFATSCSEDSISDDLSSVNSSQPNNINSTLQISNDNSGIVKITPTGNDATFFTVDFGDGTSEPVTLSAGENVSHVYPEGSYTVKIIATSITGFETESLIPFQITYRAPENIEITKNIDGYNLTVSATADFANGFLVYYGDVANEIGTPMAVGQTLPPHTYPNAGTYQLRVVALSGGVATSELIEEVVIFDPFELPITFESDFINYFFGTFGDVNFAKVDNPNPTGLNTSAKVGRYTKPMNVPNWSGTYSPLDNPIDFANGNKIKVLVHASEVGKMLNVELEWAVGGNPANGVAVVKVANTVANQWQELTFDFSTIAGIPADAQFTQLVLRYNDADNGAGEVIYLDNIRLTN